MFQRFQNFQRIRLIHLIRFDLMIQSFQMNPRIPKILMFHSIQQNHLILKNHLIH